jgi:hypothetical protein
MHISRHPTPPVCVRLDFESIASTASSTSITSDNRHHKVTLTRPCPLKSRNGMSTSCTHPIPSHPIRSHLFRMTCRTTRAMGNSGAINALRHKCPPLPSLRGRPRVLRNSRHQPSRTGLHAQLNPLIAAVLPSQDCRDFLTREGIGITGTTSHISLCGENPISLHREQSYKPQLRLAWMATPSIPARHWSCSIATSQIQQ